MTQYISTLAPIIAEKTGQSVADTKKTMWATFEALAQIVAEGDSFSVPNFGTLGSREHAATKVRHIVSREIITVPAHRRVHFSASDTLTGMVRSGNATSIRKKNGRRTPKG